MAVTCRTICDIMEGFAPGALAMDYDNVGLLVGDLDASVDRVLVALEVTQDVIDEAVRLGADMIVTHHPLMLRPVGRLTKGAGDAGLAYRLAREGICHFAAHTNLDTAPGGVNDALAKKLGVAVEGWLEGPSFLPDGREYGMGRCGTLTAVVPFPDYLARVKTALDANGLRCWDAGRPVHRVALCGGSGGEFVAAAAQLGCDTLVTADVKYHQFLEAKERGVNLIDADHFCTENVVVPVLADMLKKGFPDVDVEISKVHRQTVQFYV